MQTDQQTPAVTPTDEFVSFFAMKRRDTILGAMSAVAFLHNMVGRRHKWYPDDPDVFSIAVKALESLISKHYVSTFLQLSCECVVKSHQPGRATRPYRLKKGFNPEEAHRRLSELFDQKSAGRPLLWKQVTKGASEANPPRPPLPSSQVSNDVARSNAFSITQALQWYDAALIAAFFCTPTYRRAGNKKQGRRYHPLQNVSSEGKALSLKGTGLMDIDFAKCHPTILQCLLGGRSLALRSYLSGPQTRETKDDVNAVIHGLKHPKTPLGMRLLLEMPFIKKQLLSREERRSGRGMFDLLTKWEDRALKAVEGALLKLGKGIHLLMFDGLICDPISDTHLRWIEGEVAVETGMTLRLEVKRVY